MNEKSLVGLGIILGLLSLQHASSIGDLRSLVSYQKRVMAALENLTTI
ncbi:MAG: hypothetical protein AABW49_00140 [Nanoarchaeota archaeon]